jgi:sigma-B regulation protein RsbU (phosphoserine phosphatase)
MAGVQASLRGLCAGGVRDLGELLTRLNALVFDATPRNRFATLWCGQYDPATRILRYASAGHGDALIARAGGELECASCRGLALGLVRHARYESASLELRPGDLLAVCTDGVTEARSSAGEEFGEDAWARLVDGSRGMAAAAVVGRVLQHLDEFARGAEQHDDITLVAAQHFPIHK